MNIEQIKKLQSEYGLAEIQSQIEDGTAWKMEGSVGRAAMSHLKSGACFLPDVSHRDYYGNRIPARQDLKEGSTGTLENSIEFWDDPSNYM